MSSYDLANESLDLSMNMTLQVSKTDSTGSGLRYISRRLRTGAQLFDRTAALTGNSMPV